jgi:hypothetical protein
VTAGTSPDLPQIGDVLRYIYLFKHEARYRDDGIKERPVVVIDVDHDANRVAVVAITTKSETFPGTVTIPDEVARAAKLQLKSGVVITEYNIFTWLGYDIRPLADGYVAARFPPRFASRIRQAAIDGDASGINRD